MKELTEMEKVILSCGISAEILILLAVALWSIQFPIMHKVWIGIGLGVGVLVVFGVISFVVYLILNDDGGEDNPFFE